jgi:hypothetical protein
MKKSGQTKDEVKTLFQRSIWAKNTDKIKPSTVLLVKKPILRGFSEVHELYVPDGSKGLVKFVVLGPLRSVI